MSTSPKKNRTGYYEPTAANATHLLDNRELVTQVRPALHITHEIERHDAAALLGGRKRFLYPQISRVAMRTHGLYLAHNIPQHRDDYNGDLLVTGDRLAPIPCQG